MTEVVVLSTHWRDDYWETDDESTAIYPDRHYTDMDGWHELADDCPVGGIGIYHTRIKDEEFVYLRVTEMTYKSHNGEPKFTYETVGVADTPSRELNRELSNDLYHAIKWNRVVNTLDELGEELPAEWEELVNE